jgi:hypothetical protein
MMASGARHVEGRIAFLKAELKVTDAQLPLWNPVAGAMRGRRADYTSNSASSPDRRRRRGPVHSTPG